MNRRTRKLAVDVQRFVVCGLACFEKPTAVAAALKKEFGIAVTAQAVEAYDPTKRAGRRLSKQWRDLFETSREKFLRETAAIGIAHKTVRLCILQRMIDAAEKKQNYSLVAQFLEQAAKEVGNAYTNHRVISGPLGRPIQTQAITPGMTAHEAQAAWLMTMGDGPP